VPSWPRRPEHDALERPVFSPDSRAADLHELSGSRPKSDASRHSPATIVQR
jgi:hypothetical protein